MLHDILTIALWLIVIAFLMADPVTLGIIGVATGGYSAIKAGNAQDKAAKAAGTVGDISKSAWADSGTYRDALKNAVMGNENIFAGIRSLLGGGGGSLGPSATTPGGPGAAQQLGAPNIPAPGGTIGNILASGIIPTGKRRSKKHGDGRLRPPAPAIPAPVTPTAGVGDPGAGQPFSLPSFLDFTKTPGAPEGLPPVQDYNNPLSAGVKSALTRFANISTDQTANRMNNSLQADLIDRGLTGGGTLSSQGLNTRLGASNWLTRTRGDQAAQLATTEQDRGDMLRALAEDRAWKVADYGTNQQNTALSRFASLLGMLTGQQGDLAQYGFGSQNTALAGANSAAGLYAGQAATLGNNATSGITSSASALAQWLAARNAGGGSPGAALPGTNGMINGQPVLGTNPGALVPWKF